MNATLGAHPVLSWNSVWRAWLGKGPFIDYWCVGGAFIQPNASFRQAISTSVYPPGGWGVWPTHTMHQLKFSDVRELSDRGSYAHEEACL